MSKREILVGYWSGLEFWRKARVASGDLASLDLPGPIIGAREERLLVRVRRALGMCGLDGRLHVARRADEPRFNSPGLVSHCWRGPLSTEHVLKLGDGLSVCRVPVIFVQLAQELDVIDLALLAYELTGRYGLTPWASDSFDSELDPLADVDELRAYAAAARAMRVRGGARALEALRYVVPNAKSPREASVALFLSLPRVQGGCGFAGFELNRGTGLPARLWDALGQKRVIPDFSWKDTFVEYDSDGFHRTIEQRARDDRKRLAYESCGMKLLTLTNGILQSNALVEEFVDDLARALGVRRRPPTVEMEAKRRALRERLFGLESADAAIREAHRTEGV